MTISYSFPLSSKAVKLAAGIDAQNRGYSESLSEQYAQEKINVTKKTAPVYDSIVLGTIAATAGKIALDARNSFKLPITKQFPKREVVRASIRRQFAPFVEQINKVAPTIRGEKNILKKAGKEVLKGFEVVGRGLKGVYMSIPPKIRIAATVLYGLVLIKDFSEQNKVDAKYDTLK